MRNTIQRVLIAVTFLSLLSGCLAQKTALKPGTLTPLEEAHKLCEIDLNKLAAASLSPDLGKTGNNGVGRGRPLPLAALDLGLTGSNAALFRVQQDNLHSEGKIVLADTRTGRLLRILPASIPFGADDVMLAPDGVTMVGIMNGGDISLPLPRSNALTVLRASDFKPLNSISVGADNNISHVYFHPGHPEQVILSMTSAVPVVGNPSDHYYADARLSFLDWRSGRIIKSLAFGEAPPAEAKGARYKRAGRTTDIDRQGVLFSPDQKLIVCCFSGGGGEGGGGGGFDVLDAKTGELVWRVDNKHTDITDGRYFFLSSDQFVFDGYVYNLRTRHEARLLPKGDRRQACVSGVSGHPGLAFFQTKTGLELWDLKHGRRLQRWPEIRTADGVSLSPDETVMAAGDYVRGVIQYWTFDPRRLKTTTASGQ